MKSYSITFLTIPFSPSEATTPSGRPSRRRRTSRRSSRTSSSSSDDLDVQVPQLEDVLRDSSCSLAVDKIETANNRRCKFAKIFGYLIVIVKKYMIN